MAIPVHFVAFPSLLGGSSAKLASGAKKTRGKGNKRRERKEEQKNSTISRRKKRWEAKESNLVHILSLGVLTDVVKEDREAAQR